MEELRKLEKVQRMVEFVESRGVSNFDQHSNRFLANFILFLIEPCGDLPINHKCSLLSQFMPTLSSAFLQDAYQHHLVTAKPQNTGFQQNLVENALHSCHQTKDYSVLQSCNEDMAMVGLDSMQRANSTLEDFVEELHMEFLSISEFLVEVSDDLVWKFPKTYENLKTSRMTTMIMEILPSVLCLPG
ncbi:hypothetical protein VNO77_43396 [Canavalia gladiata]|uniref:Uncharacterized protein n=1 Tax=Canavalia gladiata TaxID=3824 RepID=A0AAN9JU02_CANGL